MTTQTCMLSGYTEKTKKPKIKYKLIVTPIDDNKVCWIYFSSKTELFEELDRLSEDDTIKTILLRKEY